MICFDYQCPKCQYIRGEYRYSSEDTSTARHPCQMCEVPMIKILSPTYGKVKGTSTPTKIKREKRMIVVFIVGVVVGVEVYIGM